MFLTEKEIFSQYDALDKTYRYLVDKAEDIRNFRDAHKFNSITYTGSGSSYSLCQSAEMSTKIHMALAAHSLPAGDLMLNFEHYKNIIKNTVVVTFSRSGSTSEVLMAIKQAKEKYSVPCISICAKQNAEISHMADLNLDLPWAFDESVCQTRTVTNLYAANLILTAILSDNQDLLQEIKRAIDTGAEYMENNKATMQQIANEVNWDKVVILADSELQGIGSEGALAFKEIPQVPSNSYHLLDVRHGPMVLIDEKTLVILAGSPFEISYQRDLVKDLKAKGAVVVTIDSREHDKWLSDYHVLVPAYNHYGVMGIPFIFVPQTIAYYKALARGINPDLPQGLSPWIKL